MSVNGENLKAEHNPYYSLNKIDRIGQFINKLIKSTETVSEISLYNGKTGILLALHHAAKSIPNWPLLKQTITILQEEISEKAGRSNDTFEDGLFGIGWGINHLYEQNFIKENQTEVLNSFDDELYKLVMYSKADNHSLKTGTMGRILYYLQRTPENLKLYNKYAYVCNYEILMLLVDDFTNENENIIASLKSNSNIQHLIINDLGKTISQIFNLLTILKNKGIHKQITERQWLQFLKYFLTVYEDNKIDKTNRNELINWIFICNNLLKCASISKTIADKIATDITFFEFIPETLEEIVLHKSYNNNKAHYFRKPPTYVIEHDFVNELNKFGMDGLSGFVCLCAVTEKEENRISKFMEELFLI